MKQSNCLSMDMFRNRMVNLQTPGLFLENNNDLVFSSFHRSSDLHNLRDQRYCFSINLSNLFLFQNHNLVLIIAGGLRGYFRSETLHFWIHSPQYFNNSSHYNINIYT